MRYTRVLPCASLALALALALALPATALAQADTKDVTSRAAAPEQRPPVAEEVVVRAPQSPAWTQDRNFPGTRFWALDPGRIELEAWYRGKVPRHEGPDHLFQVEAEIGLYPRIQLDVYENFQKLHEDAHLTQEGNQIEARITLAENYGEIWGNPAVYLEWHPRHDAPDKFEFRLLFGGEILPYTYAAVNPFFEMETGGAHEREYGVTAAATHEIVKDVFRLGAEFKAEWAFSHDDRSPGHELYLGPNFIWRPLGNRFKIMFTGFVGLNQPEANVFEPQLIVGTQF
jgi:hypothetical protein